LSDRVFLPAAGLALVPFQRSTPIAGLARQQSLKRLNVTPFGPAFPPFSIFPFAEPVVNTAVGFSPPARCAHH